MPKFKNIAQLRKTIRKLEDEVTKMAVFAPSAKESEAYDNLSMELHDLDWALYNAVFIKNNSKLLDLINGLNANIEDAEKVRTQIQELTDSFKKATQIVKEANNFAGKGKEILDEIKETLDELHA